MQIIEEYSLDSWNVELNESDYTDMWNILSEDMAYFQKEIIDYLEQCIIDGTICDNELLEHLYNLLKEYYENSNSKP